MAAPAWGAGPDPDASASGRCHAFGADFAPSRGDPQRLRVRFTVYKFGRNRPIYLHYIGPNRHLKRTVFLGTTRGLCGYLRTGYRRLFPFTARAGHVAAALRHPAVLPGAGAAAVRDAGGYRAAELGLSEGLTALLPARRNR